MRQRPIMKFRPGLERLEAKQLLNATRLATHGVSLKDGATAWVRHPADTSSPHGAAGAVAANLGGPLPQAHPRPRAPVLPQVPTAFLAFRVTQKPYKLVPPFQQVLVQAHQPVPGQVYNVTYVTLKNQTAQTFDASSGFTVRLTNQPPSHALPILTGTQQWKPGQVIVFYVLTKKYYPVSFVAGGFFFNLGGRVSTLVPGPSAIFLRLRYNPATFARTLDWIVAYGQGAQLGLGPKFGIPDTAINAFVAARTHRIDYGGHF
jgi:hypothetical protein